MAVPEVNDLKSRRLALNLSQAALSKLAGLQENYVCRIEGDAFREPSSVKIRAIDAALTKAESKAAKASK